MTISIKTERALTTSEEFILLAKTHFPELLDLDHETLWDTKKRLRDLRDKERTFVHGLRRSMRGKADTRGGSFPGNVERPARRKQIFVGALKRVNAEVARRHSLAAREAMMASAGKALALKKNAARRHHPVEDGSGSPGMAAIENRRARSRINRAKVGRVSQATKVAQASRDARQ